MVGGAFFGLWFQNKGEAKKEEKEPLVKKGEDSV
jgi:hypothetical protein